MHHFTLFTEGMLSSHSQAWPSAYLVAERWNRGDGNGKWQALFGQTHVPLNYDSMGGWYRKDRDQIWHSVFLTLWDWFAKCGVAVFNGAFLPCSLLQRRCPIWYWYCWWTKSSLKPLICSKGFWDQDGLMVDESESKVSLECQLDDGNVKRTVLLENPPYFASFFLVGKTSWFHPLCFNDVFTFHS